MVEYGLILGLISIVIMAVLIALGDNTDRLYDQSAQKIAETLSSISST